MPNETTQSDFNWKAFHYSNRSSDCQISWEEKKTRRFRFGFNPLLEEGGGDKENIIKSFGAVQENFRGTSQIPPNFPVKICNRICCVAIFTKQSANHSQGKLMNTNTTKES
jgi:hypothetical protein